MSVFIPARAPGCLPPELRRPFDEAVNNLNFFNDVFNNNVITYVEGDVVEEYFTNPGVPDEGGSEIRTIVQPPPVKFELTTSMTESTGVWTASAKLLDETLTKVGNAFTVTDIFHMWHHATTSDRGLLGKDEDMGVYFPLFLNTPTLRTGVLQNDLESTSIGSPANPEDVVANGVTYSVYGVLVPSGRHLEAGASVYVTFYYDRVANKYFAISTNVCSTT